MLCSKFLPEENAHTRLAAHEVLIAASLKNYKEMTPGGALRQNPAYNMMEVEFLGTGISTDAI